MSNVTLPIHIFLIFVPQPHLVALAHVLMEVIVSIKEPVHISVNVLMATQEPTAKFQVRLINDPIQITLIKSSVYIFLNIDKNQMSLYQYVAVSMHIFTIFVLQPHLVTPTHVSMVATVSIKEQTHISVNVSMDTLEPTAKFQVSLKMRY